MAVSWTRPRTSFFQVAKMAPADMEDVDDEVELHERGQSHHQRIPDAAGPSRRVRVNSPPVDSAHSQRTRAEIWNDHTRPRVEKSLPTTAAVLFTYGMVVRVRTICAPHMAKRCTPAPW